MRKPDHYLPVAVSLDGIAGYAWAQDYGAHLRSGDRTVRLHDLYVAPDHRGLGVGAALFDVVREWARHDGVRYLEWQASLSAVPFYESLGYRGDPCLQPEYPSFEIDFSA